MAQVINICMSCDNENVKHAGVVIASVLYNANKNNSLNFYIIGNEISEENKNKLSSLKSIKECSINFVSINENLFEDYKQIKAPSYLALGKCYRLKLPTILDNIDKVIYLDCDTVVNTDLTELYNTVLNDHFVAGVKDINHRMLKKNPYYINTGMLLLNLKKMREQNIEQKFFEYTKNNLPKIKIGEQQIINDVLIGKIKLINPKWNVQTSNFTNRSIYTNDPWIIRYTGKQKPWIFGNWNYYTEYYYRYLRLTPWTLGDKEKDFIIKSKLAAIIGYIKYRPLFILRPRFYKAINETYIKPFFKRNQPIIKNNTFVVWEPCSKSHAEVVPGYVKYLLDLGYNVSVLVHPARLKEGLFARFSDKNLILNKISKRSILKYFKHSDLSEVQGLLVTTAGKLCDSIHYDEVYTHFKDNVDKSKIFLVEHEAKPAVDEGTFKDNLIMLREMDYKNILTPKNEDITNFVTVGAIQGKRKNNELIINSVKVLHEQGYRNFKVTVIGKGNLKGLPAELHPYFDIKGRLPFDKMYDEIEKADFMLTSYDENNQKHLRYKTTGTSGNFQLVYGFLKPCIIIESFAPINGFNNTNSILYKSDNDYSKAMAKAIEMNSDEYNELQNNLKIYADNLYNKSLENFKKLISKER